MDGHIKESVLVDCDNKLNNYLAAFTLLLSFLIAPCTLFFKGSFDFFLDIFFNKLLILSTTITHCLSFLTYPMG